MPTYTYPGVYIQEVDTGNKPIEGVSTSIAGFLGIAERGPIIATFIASYADFQRSFGAYYTDSTGNQAYLAYAVEGFFLNGGQECWVARVTSSTATTASVNLGSIVISAAGPGASGGQIGYWIQPAGIRPTDPTWFKLSVFYFPSAAAATAAAGTTSTSTATQIEVFDNLSINPQASTYFVGAVNSGSNLITVTQPAAGGNVAVTAAIKLLDGTGGTKGGDGAALVENDFLGNAADPANPATTPSGLAALDAVDDISIYCCPDEHRLDAAAAPSPIANVLQTHCELLMDRFAILQAAPNPGKPATVTPTTNSQRGYSAFYYPWLNVAGSKDRRAHVNSSRWPHRGYLRAQRSE